MVNHVPNSNSHWEIYPIFFEPGSNVPPRSQAIQWSPQVLKHSWRNMESKRKYHGRLWTHIFEILDMLHNDGHDNIKIRETIGIDIYA